MVEHWLPKPRVAGSSPVYRSLLSYRVSLTHFFTNMTETIKHVGRVEKVTSGFVTVRILQSSACSGCSAAKLCQSSETKEKFVDVRMDDTSCYHTGQEVVLQGSVQQGLKATWWAYVVPLGIVVLTILVAVLVGLNDALAALVALGVLVLYYFIMYTQRTLFESKFGFTILTN